MRYNHRNVIVYHLRNTNAYIGAVKYMLCSRLTANTPVRVYVFTWKFEVTGLKTKESHSLVLRFHWVSARVKRFYPSSIPHSYTTSSKVWTKGDLPGPSCTPCVVRRRFVRCWGRRSAWWRSWCTGTAWCCSATLAERNGWISHHLRSQPPSPAPTSCPVQREKREERRWENERRI